MSNVYVTFSADKYHNTTKRIVEDAPKFGADQVLVYDDPYLIEKHPGFIDRMKWFFDHPQTRGFGWFTWKPYILLLALKRMKDGDVLLWTDADTYPIADLRPLYNTCKADGGAMFFNALGCIMNVWCKRDCFLVMGCDAPKYWYATQAVARFMLFQKGSKFNPEAFLWEWLAYTANPLCNTFDPSVLGHNDMQGFIQHRCEQAVLGNLVEGAGRKLYREACAYGNGGKEDWDIYPQTFVQWGENSYDRSRKGLPGSSFRNVD